MLKPDRIYPSGSASPATDTRTPPKRLMFTSPAAARPLAATSSCPSSEATVMGMAAAAVSLSLVRQTTMARGLLYLPRRGAGPGGSADTASISCETGSGKSRGKAIVGNRPDNTPVARMERMELARSLFRMLSSGTMIATTSTRKTAARPYRSTGPQRNGAANRRENPSTPSLRRQPTSPPAAGWGDGMTCDCI